MAYNAFSRRGLLALVAGGIAARAWAQTDPSIAPSPATTADPARGLTTAPGDPTAPAGPRVHVITSEGPFTLELYPDKAPLTVANFLRYVKTRRFDGANFYRALRTPGASDSGLIQGGLQNDPAKLYPPVAHESPLSTGLRHTDGTISMARGAPGSATADFFICIGPAASLDGDLTPGGVDPGFAAFGRVIQGMEVVKTILAEPTNGHARNPVMQGQILDHPVKIISMRLER